MFVSLCNRYLWSHWQTVCWVLRMLVNRLHPWSHGAFCLAGDMCRRKANNYSPIYVSMKVGTLGKGGPYSFHFHWKVEGKVTCSERGWTWTGGLKGRMMIRNRSCRKEGTDRRYVNKSRAMHIFAWIFPNLSPRTWL